MSLFTISAEKPRYNPYMILIIGAGPAGLAMGRQLQKRKLPFRIVEKHQVGHAWHNHYDSLHLHTLKQVSHLPDLPMPDDYPDFPSRAQFLAYQQAYATHFDLPIETGVEVTDLRFSQEQWHAATTDGTIEADIVIAASGIWGNPVSAEFVGQAGFQGEIVQAMHYKNASPYAGKSVLVVGGGNTASEIAVELAEHGVDSAIAIRHGTTFVPYPTSAAAMRAAATLFRTLPATLGDRLLASARQDFSDIGLQPNRRRPTQAYPVVGFELPEAIRAGNVRLFGDIERLTADGVRFVDGQQLAADVIMLAIGYRPNVQFAADYLTFDDRGWPKVCAHYRTLKGYPLFCISADYPATSGWIQNISRVTRIVARFIKQTSG